MLSPSSRSRRPDALNRARLYIDERYTQRLTLRQVAHAVKLSRTYLCHAFKKANGCTLLEYLSRRRMEKARTLLRDTALMVKEVAFVSGFAIGRAFQPRLQRSQRRGRWNSAGAPRRQGGGCSRDVIVGIGRAIYAKRKLHLFPRTAAGIREVWSTVSRDGGATWGPNVQVYKSPDGHVCECCHPSVAIDPQGRIAVMFRNWLGGLRDMYVAISADAGKTFAPAEKLGTGTWKLNGCPMDGGALAFTADGKPTTVWRREKTIFAAEGSASEQRLADSGLQAITVAGKFGKAYLWEQGGGLTLKKGNATAARFAENASFAAAASAPDRDPVVVWEATGSGEKTIFAEVLRRGVCIGSFGRSARPESLFRNGNRPAPARVEFCAAS